VLQKAYKHEEWVLNQAWKYILKAATLQKNRSSETNQMLMMTDEAAI